MSPPGPTESGDAERAARLLAMGRILPYAGSEGTLEDVPTPSGQDSTEAALRREVPPHHGG